jgi:hypothetical protein
MNGTEITLANRTLRVRRVTSHEDFWASLASDEHVLPLWFSDGERDRVARTIDPRLATLAPRGERSFATMQIACRADDWVVVTSPAMVPLARRYAAITGRRFLADLALPTAHQARSQPSHVMACTSGHGVAWRRATTLMSVSGRCGDFAL